MAGHRYTGLILEPYDMAGSGWGFGQYSSDYKGREDCARQMFSSMSRGMSMGVRVRDFFTQKILLEESLNGRVKELIQEVEKIYLPMKQAWKSHQL